PSGAEHMKIKAFFALLTLGLSATVATAGPVTASASGLNTLGFSSTSSFVLAADQLFSGVVTATTALQGDLSIGSLTLSNGSVSYVFDGNDDPYKFLSVGTVKTTELVKGFSVDKWVTSYQLSDVLLSAGTWSMTVVGNDAPNKYTGSFNVQLNAVPEPQSLALALIGVVAVGAATRRRRATR
ncbi:MAG: PEP-CTERM sorting domain-containing protein, partial [Burkholderiaceae bacterium]